MSNPTHKSYKFSNFQELVDRVPSDRIAECLREIGIVLAMGKSNAELIYNVALHLAEKDGRTLLPIPERVITIPVELAWDDDGKHQLVANMVTP